METGAARVGGGGTAEAQFGEIQLVHKCIDHADRIIFANIIVDAFRQKEALASIPAFNIARQVSHLPAPVVRSTMPEP